MISDRGNTSDLLFKSGVSIIGKKDASVIDQGDRRKL